MSFLTKRPNGFWYIVEKISLKKRKYISTREKSKAKANIVLAEFSKNKKRILSRDFSLSDLENSIMNNAEANNLKPKTIEIYKKVFKNLKTFFNDKQLNTFRASDFDYYKSKRFPEISQVSINIELRALKKFLRFAFKNELLSEDLSSKVDLYIVTDNKKKHFNESELNLIFETIEEGEIKDICQVTYLTASRRNEILNLKYKDVDLENRIINIFQEKPKKDKTLKQLHISVELYNIFKKYLLNVNGTQKVYDLNETIFKISPSWVSHKFKKIIRKLKLDDNLNFHSLRHTAATNLIKSSVSIYNAKSILGHSSTKVTEGYIHMSPENFKGDMEKLKTRDN